MEIFDFSFSVIELIAIGLLLVAFIYQLYFYIRYMNGVLRQRRKLKKTMFHLRASNHLFRLLFVPKTRLIICENSFRLFFNKYTPISKLL
jgi:hypothetical protein